MRLTALALLIGLSVSGCLSSSPSSKANPSSVRPPALGTEYPGAACDPHDESTRAKETCQEVFINVQDRTLDAGYWQLRGTYEPVADLDEETAAIVRRVDDAQRAWIAFRRAQCASETASTLDASGRALAILVCYQRLGEARVAQLRHQIEAGFGSEER